MVFTIAKGIALALWMTFNPAPQKNMLKKLGSGKRRKPMSEERKSKKAGGAWNKTSKAGGNYISGQITIGNRIYNFSLLPNNFKEREQQPDWNIMLSDDA